MKRIPTWAKFAAGVTAALIIAYSGFVYFYLDPVAERRDAIAREIEVADRLEEQLEDLNAIRRGLRAFGGTTLGKKEDLTIARFRDSLSAIAGQNGLSGIVVSSGPPTLVPSPALRERIASGLKNKIKARRGDFYVIRGRIKASGPVESAIRALAVIQAQPWAHRVEGFSLTPVGKDREWVELQVDVATVFAPDLAPGDAEPLPADPAQGHDAVWRSVAAKNIFRNPPPPPTPVPQQPTVVEVATQPTAAPPPVAPPPPPPYQEWRIVGVISSQRGCEVTVINTRTGERSVLTPGGSTLNAKLVRGDGEWAVFEIDGQQYEFMPGQTLANRTPARG
ncbi:MAG TPA: hypothetical protein VK176_07850 [Phycisphaerales bacterium]|nr:hypothetical protein [Phycisphaerales bacterium]